MSRILSFLDAAKNRVTIEINYKASKPQRDWENLQETNYGQFTMSGSVCGCSGQCYDEITPTPTQQKLIDFWKKYHLNTMCAGTKKQMEAIEELKKTDLYKCNPLKHHEITKTYLEEIGLYEDRGYRYGSSWLTKPYPVEEMKQITEQVFDEEMNRVAKVRALYDLHVDNEEHEQQILVALMEEMQITEQEAERIYALGKYLEIEYAELLEIESLHDQSFLCQGTEYYVGTDDELNEIALQYLHENKECWQDAVAHDATEMGLDEWAQDVIDMDGAASVLNHWDGKSDDILVNNKYITICRKW